MSQWLIENTDQIEVLVFGEAAACTAIETDIPASRSAPLCGVQAIDTDPTCLVVQAHQIDPRLGAQPTLHIPAGLRSLLALALDDANTVLSSDCVGPIEIQAAVTTQIEFTLD